jgi:Zn-dependent M16 (insulinase) family peptidase
MSSALSPVAHPAFEWKRSQHIASLNLTVEEYIHRATGAQHIHIASNNPENVFLVALRTVPEDSTGVAHILEHTALCGSEHYPVRDPFFMMIRRSLNTFMNAFTSSDWTAYPFASQNRKDFDNLLSVYLDAVFFSRLDPLDFAQEGHRLEFEKTGDTSSNLVFKGVVFNEMKGAMSSASSILWQTLTKYVFPTNTYHYNSGGDPECIPDLGYEQLRQFYKTHYHPSNAVFMTFGDIPANELQEKIEMRALMHFSKLDKTIAVHDEKRYHAPLRVEEAYACEEPSLENKTHIVVSWLLGHSTDLESTLQAQLLTAVLMENSASPLLHALETTKLGNSPSPICGLEHSQKELMFSTGLEGSDTQHTAAVEKLILDTIAEVAKDGVPLERLQACLHQLELQQREITGDGYPYGLQLILTALNSATHRGDPIALLDLEPVIAKLHEQIKNPDFIKQLAISLLLDNPHRVTLTLRPDNTLAAKRVAAEQAHLAQIKAQLSDSDKQCIIEQAQALDLRQQRKDDETILPKVTLADIPADIHIPDQHSDTQSPFALNYFPAGTNRIVYQQIVLPLPALNEQERLLLPLYANALTEMGVGQRDYLDTQNWQSAVCGSLHAFTSIRSALDNTQQAAGFFVLSSKGLHRNYPAMSDLMLQTLDSVRFDELTRFRELIAQQRARSEMAIPGNGHQFAMVAASSGASALGQYTHAVSGLASVLSIKQLDEQLNDEKQLEQFAANLQALHRKIIAMPMQFLLVSDDATLPAFRGQIGKQVPQHNTLVTAASNSVPAFGLPAISQPIQQFWQANTQVQFCAKSYTTVGSTHADAPALTVLGGFLRNGYLHRAIREQGGAYGGGASQENNIGAFRFYSYRDPRFTETLDDFDKAIAWLKSSKHEAQPLEEAILGVISSIDKPSSPAGEAKATFHNNLHHRTPQQRRDFRNAILKVTIPDLQRVTETYLTPVRSNTAVVGNNTAASTAESLGLEIIQL